MNDQFDTLTGDVRIIDGRIAEIGPGLSRSAGEEELDLVGTVLLPGFVQGHIHLCQTLFRNRADDVELLEWLKGEIWPKEASHTPETLALSADLGLFELINGGTTALLDMGTVHHTEVLFERAEMAGLRYIGGKCLMDLDEDRIVPPELIEDAEAALEETRQLIRRWHGAADGRLRYAVAPRFAVSCSESLLRDANVLACRSGVRVHTHASENCAEIETIRRRTGRDNVDFLSDCGLLGSHTTLAHCVHLSELEINLIWGSGTHVVHCPASNLKLASGLAPIPGLIEQGINVALGADGSPCNNRLSMFREMYLAALIHRTGTHSRGLNARRVLQMATINGARALGLEDEIGSIEVGKRADLIAIEFDRPETLHFGSAESAVVYGADERSVRHVLVNGEFLKRDHVLKGFDVVRLRAAAAECWKHFAQ